MNEKYNGIDYARANVIITHLPLNEGLLHLLYLHLTDNNAELNVFVTVCSCEISLTLTSVTVATSYKPHYIVYYVVTLKYF